MNIRRLLVGLAWVGAGAVLVRGVSGSCNVASSLRWLASRPRAGQRTDRPCFLFVLPMLREQRLIESAIERFHGMAVEWGAACVAVVTTEREYAEAAPDCGDTPTPDLAAALAERFGPVVRHYHVPDAGAIMVDQVNFAVRLELKRLANEGIDARRVFVAVYNADSRPDPRTLSAVAALAAADSDVRVVQQSALFTEGLGRHGATADGIALLQSRWTLAREIPRLRRQAAQARRGTSRWPRLAHCVGHGLFVRGDVLQEFVGLPTTTMNEDLAFGYLLCAAGVPIVPVPLLEFGDSPSTIIGSIRQTRQWFWSYPEYPRAHGLAAAAGLGTPRTRTLLTMQGLARGGLWLLQSPAVAATLMLPLLAQRRGPALAATVAALGAYYGLPFAAITRYLRNAGQQVHCGPQEVAGGLVACLLSSVGPWWCVGRVVRRALFGARYVHDKTED